MLHFSDEFVVCSKFHQNHNVNSTGSFACFLSAFRIHLVYSIQIASSSNDTELSSINYEFSFSY